MNEQGRGEERRGEREEKRKGMAMMCTSDLMETAGASKTCPKCS